MILNKQLVTPQIREENKGCCDNDYINSAQYADIAVAGTTLQTIHSIFAYADE